MPELTTDEQHLAVTLYRRLANREPVEVDPLAASAGMSMRAISEALERWSDGVFDAHGRVVSFGGLSLRETEHRFAVNGRTLFTWCAWDALFLPEILGATADVVSHSPLTAAPVEITVAPTALERVAPAEAVVSFVGADCCGGADVVESFCRFVHFFPSADEANRWAAELDSAFVLSVADAYDLGRRANQVRVGEALHAEATR